MENCSGLNGCARARDTPSPHDPAEIINALMIVRAANRVYLASYSEQRVVGAYPINRPTDRPTDQPRLRSTHRRVSYGNLICSYKTIYTCTMPEMYSMNELIVRSTSRILQDDATCSSTQKQCRRTCFRFTYV